MKIYLPRLESERLLDEMEDFDQPAQGERGETILVVEDDEDVRDYLVDTLRDLDYSVLAARDAKTGLGFLGRPGTRIDLLLTDVVLPGMSGRDLAREAKKARPDLTVLFMTGYSRNAIVHQRRLDRASSSSRSRSRKSSLRRAFGLCSTVGRNRDRQAACERPSCFGFGAARRARDPDLCRSPAAHLSAAGSCAAAAGRTPTSHAASA